MQADRSESEPSSENSGKPDIVELAMNRDPDALGTLYDVLYPPLFRLLFFSTRDTTVAEQIADAVVPTVLASVPHAQADAPSLRAWMMSVAWALLERDYKQALPSVGHHLPPHFLDEATTQTLEYRQSADELAAAIRQLPPFWQNYVVLRFISGLTRSEVVFVLGKPSSDVAAMETEALQELGYWLGAFQE
ncbi:MAG: hypothetical protein C4318_04775 [Acidimicrobiia bacterium]